ncbi:MAG: hypothetical protein ACLGQW_00600 [Acidobacteriota bacterium]
MKCTLKVNSSSLGIALDMEPNDAGYSVEIITTIDGKPVFNPALQVTDDYSGARMNLYADAVKYTIDGLQAIVGGYGAARIDLLDPDGSLIFTRYYEKPNTVYVDIDLDICCFSDAHCFSSDGIAIKTDMTFEDFKAFVTDFALKLDKFNASSDYKH